MNKKQANRLFISILFISMGVSTFDMSLDSPNIYTKLIGIIASLTLVYFGYRELTSNDEIKVERR